MSVNNLSKLTELEKGTGMPETRALWLQNLNSLTTMLFVKYAKLYLRQRIMALQTEIQITLIFNGGSLHIISSTVRFSI